MPSKNHYGYDQMKTEDRKKFLEWYNKHFPKIPAEKKKLDGMIKFCNSLSIQKRFKFIEWHNDNFINNKSNYESLVPDERFVK
jgi:hypothetical protein